MRDVPASLVACDVVMRDGSTLALREALPADTPAIVEFLRGLTPESLHQRFFGACAINERMVGPLIPDGPGAGRALIGESAGRIVAFAGFQREPARPHEAEVSFTIADAQQGRGIGMRLLERLAEQARRDGVTTFVADVMADNRRMLDVFLDCGYSVTERPGSDVTRLVIALQPTSEFADHAARRAQTAAAASMRPFFEPRAVAVIGANRERGKIGSEILHNLQTAGFTGQIAPIHPVATEVDGLPAYPSLDRVPYPIDLAIVVVPAAQVPDVVDACIAKGVRGICVISAGFGEAGEEGRQRERILLEKVRAAGCRLVGPNCMGLLNTDPAFALNATFSPVYPPPGGVAMSTQSGALGLAILDYARELNIGISSFVSVGNKTDVSGNDLIQYWSEDPRTSVILLYLESFGNPRKFVEIARRVGRRKPIVAVKAGRSHAGARAASSHTGALAASDAVVAALFRQAGVIRTDTLEELFDAAALLAHQPVPAGRRVAILTNAGGPGILAADACEARGLTLPSLSDATRAELRSFLPASASVGNPVDMLASAPAEHFSRALAAILADDNVDSVLTIFIPPLVTAPDDAARAIVEAAQAAGSKPVAAIFMRADGAPQALAPIPCYAFPEAAAIALAHAADYGEWRRRPLGVTPAYADIDMRSLRVIVDDAMSRGGGWLTPGEVVRVLRAAGLAVADSREASTATAAADAASEIGFPVVLKGTGPTLLHKTERHAVRLGLTSAADVRAAADEMRARLGGDLESFVVQRMIEGGVEMLVGAVHDASFGPLVVCGSGGVLVDLLGDPAVRLYPLTTADASAMIDSLRGAPLLRGYRGGAAADEPALKDVILRVSALIGICPEIQELDLNPVKVLASGAPIVDARIRVGQPPAGPAASRRIEY